MICVGLSMLGVSNWKRTPHTNQRFESLHSWFYLIENHILLFLTWKEPSELASERYNEEDFERIIGDRDQ